VYARLLWLRADTAAAEQHRRRTDDDESDEDDSNGDNSDDSDDDDDDDDDDNDDDDDQHDSDYDSNGNSVSPEHAMQKSWLGKCFSTYAKMGPARGNRNNGNSAEFAGFPWEWEQMSRDSGGDWGILAVFPRERSCILLHYCLGPSAQYSQCVDTSDL